MKEISLSASYARYLPDKRLNPNRVDVIYIRAKTLKRAVELVNQYGPPGRRNLTMHHLRKYGCYAWGTNVIRPQGENEGVWITRDPFDKVLVPVWTSGLSPRQQMHLKDEVTALKTKQAVNVEGLAAALLDSGQISVIVDGCWSRERDLNILTRIINQQLDKS